MNNVIIKNDVKIENMIYEIRGKQVMLDSDLAKLYNVEDIVLNLLMMKVIIFWSKFSTKK